MNYLKYQAVRSSGLLPAIRNCQKKHDSAGKTKICLLGLVMIFVNSERIILSIRVDVFSITKDNNW